MLRSSIMNRLLSVIIFCTTSFLSCTTNCIYPDRHNPHIPVSKDCDEITNLVTVALFGAATALVGYGFYRFGQWLLDPSNKKIVTTKLL